MTPLGLEFIESVLLFLVSFKFVTSKFTSEEWNSHPLLGAAGGFFSHLFIKCFIGRLNYTKNVIFAFTQIL